MIASIAATVQDPYRALQYHLLQRPRLRDCDGPGCGKTVHEKETPGAFARCANCRLMQYCSRDCQKADWRDSGFPHKEICGMLQALYSFSTLDGTMTPDEWSDVCRLHALPLDTVDKLISWASGGRNRTNYAGTHSTLENDTGRESTGSSSDDYDYFVRVPPTPDHRIFINHKESSGL
ncbi:hypothetical protein AURDEDRAFT_175918 [Auricularia subglabra TFB-10046 SS5]|uniref:MYND-type domain-containing protein n=1 Tax=Auricularia subglabra (strain TFB-10046 / SS5) TaxID=717982 RepID=J0LDZ2_AURST|nr:hypothetical protein AURDEDRAFT_175918 [Auricularia subglabra TFB-10046 SS5]